MNKSDKILTLSTIVLIGFVIAVIFHYVLGFYIGAEYPCNTFLTNPKLVFEDFILNLPKIKDFAPYARPDYWMNYFPLAYILMFPFTLIKNKILGYCIFLTIFLLFWFPINIKNFFCENLNKFENFQNIFILAIMSYPFLNAIDRGNFDMFLVLLLGAVVYLFKYKKYFSASMLLAVINAIKPFTLIFLLLFIFEKKWKEFFLSIFLTFLLIVGGFMVLKGNFFDQISIYITNLMLTQKVFVYEPTGGMSNSSSLFMSLKFLFYSTFKIISLPAIIRICSFINLLAAIITIFFAYKENVFWKKISLLTLYMLTFPFIVFDYKLLFLFIPIWLFVNSKEKSKFDLIYTILFGLLLIPKRFIFIGITKIIVFSVILNPLIMLILISLIIFEQFNLKQKGNSNEN